MSLLLQLGARVRGASDELPVAAVAAAADRLRVAIDLLSWVRRASMRPIGVPQLAGALEHTEHAAHALLVAREELAAYLTAIGLAAEAAPADPLGRSAPVAANAGPATQAQAPSLPPLRRWWCDRVDALTGRTGGYDEKNAAEDSTELLRRVAAAPDRDRLHAELVRSGAPVGLGLAAAAPAALRNLAAELLGRPAGPKDLPELVKATGQRLREQLPNLPPEVATELLGRTCRVPPTEPPGTTPHPADAAIAGAVLVAALLPALDRKPDDIDRYLILPEPPDA